MNKYISEYLAEKILSINYDDIPMKTIKRTKKSIIDYIGVVIAGYSYGTVMSKEVLMLSKDKKREATIIGEGCKSSMQNTALANGTLSHVVELDDGHNKALGHPGASVVTAALSVGEYNKKGGKDLLAAIVAGYEIFVRLGEAINPSHRKRGFHTTGTCGTFAAAAAAGKLLDLNKQQLVNALALAGLQSAGLMEVTEDGQMAKAFHAGKSSQAGVISALLAQRNCRGPSSIFEGNNGFFKSYCDRVKPEYLKKQALNGYAIDECYTKIYPSCRHTHPPIDAILEIKNQKKVILENIKRIIIKTYPAAIKITGQIYFPDTVEEAKFSIPFCVGAALKTGRLSLKEFNEMLFNDNQIKKIIGKIELKEEKSLEDMNPRKRGADIKIFLTNGCSYEKSIFLPKGEPETPLSDVEFKEKFKLCTDNIFNIQRREKILDLVYRIEKIKNVGNLIKILK